MASEAVDHFNPEILGELPDAGPVVMLNLVRFAERSRDGNGSGRDAYQRYSQAAIRLIKARGGTVLWAGAVEAVALGIADGNAWDYVVLVRYPSRAAFIDMVTSADYAAANVHRRNGVAAHVILAVNQTYGKLAVS
jgi:uncharacterized protein (DUF1330 family)